MQNRQPCATSTGVSSSSVVVSPASAIYRGVNGSEILERIDSIEQLHNDGRAPRHNVITARPLVIDAKKEAWIIDPAARTYTRTRTLTPPHTPPRYPAHTPHRRPAMTETIVRVLAP